MRAVLVQSTAAFLSSISSWSKRSGSIVTFARAFASLPTSLRFATTFFPCAGLRGEDPPLAGPLGSGPRIGPAPAGPREGPLGALVGPAPGGPRFGPLVGPAPGGPRLGPGPAGPRDGPACGPR